MSVFDVVIRGGTVVSPEGRVQADVAVADGRVAALVAPGTELEPPAPSTPRVAICCREPSMSTRIIASQASPTRRTSSRPRPRVPRVA
ncbi:MAG: hypothetical protein R3C32_01165 [Chloroflexota bacterium]